MGPFTAYRLVVGKDGYEVSDDRSRVIVDWLERDDTFHHELEDFREWWRAELG